MSESLKSVVVDFTRDLSLVFPEWSHLWNKWQTATDAEYETLHAYCLEVYPERFFDILYSNADIFDAKNTNTNVNFLPDVDFKMLYSCEGVSDNTRQCIWKYLQLILMTILGSVKNSDGFGNASNIFEAIHEEDLQKKMAETMESISDFFQKTATTDTENATDTNTDTDTEKGFQMPNMEKLHEHMKEILEGKIGKLAKEFTDEFADEMGDMFKDLNTDNSKDLLMQIIKNPQKMMLIFKKLVSKLQDKMKKGEISQEELMTELNGIMEKMKSMGGGKGDFADIFKMMKDMPFMKMLEKTMGGKGRMDINAVNRMTAQSETKDRLKKKLEQRQQAKAQVKAVSSNEYVVQIGTEKQEKSGIRPAPLTDDELVKMFNKKSSKKSKK